MAQSPGLTRTNFPSPEGEWPDGPERLKRGHIGGTLVLALAITAAAMWALDTVAPSQPAPMHRTPR